LLAIARAKQINLKNRMKKKWKGLMNKDEKDL
jgi:hypothetical protein